MDLDEDDALFAATEDFKKSALPADEKLKSIQFLATQVQITDQEIELLKQRLKEAEDRKRKIIEQDLPDAMRSVGMTNFTLDDGTGISLKNEVYAGISEKNRSACLEWLRDNGFGDLIKNEIKVNFGMGDDIKAGQLRAAILNQHLDFSEKSTVLPQTLKAFIKEQDAKGVNVPENIFSIHRTTVAKFKR